ncbi:hypothetical protein Nepgr_009718 [Nepenthes gracilis]|uniref:Uncharacterized protein n=1 Tax=Nepenthes gracilis TaxID=150966 RepID=A0AAD3SB13_NEPGR|nr:hypothetical protein Nepgr_009718 [Nepenthes gracilis]
MKPPPRKLCFGDFLPCTFPLPEGIRSSRRQWRFRPNKAPSNKTSRIFSNLPSPDLQQPLSQLHPLIYIFIFFPFPIPLLSLSLHLHPAISDLVLIDRLGSRKTQRVNNLDRDRSGMAEEQRYEAPKLCANDCGFFGSPTTLNLCSRCYRDHCLKEQQQRQQEQDAYDQKMNEKVITTIQTTSSSSVPISGTFVVSDAETLSLNKAVGEDKSGSVATSQDGAVPPSSCSPNRCRLCRKRVALTGFRCRCGAVFCGAHRYPELHACTFDFKGSGREAIEKANPVVKAEKLDKI